MASPLNIAVVEDHDALRALTVELLLARGYSAVGVASAEALDWRAARATDLFVIDLNLPGEDGLSLSSRIRSACPQAGIVMVTARTGRAARVAGYAHGADVYLPKPVAPEELLAVIAALGRRLQPSPVGAVHAARTGPAAITLDTLQLALVSARARVALTPHEAALVEALMRAPRRQLGLSRIAEVLGLSPHDMSKASLEVRVVRLRRKLTDAGGEPPAIKAVRGYGYQLCASLTLA